MHLEGGRMTRLMLIIGGALALALLCAAALAQHWHGQLADLRRDNHTLTGERNQAQATLNNQIRAVTLFNDIAAAAQANHQADDNDSEKTQTTIKTIIKDNACAVELAPAPAADQLRAHADRLRARTASTHTGGSAG